MRARAGEVLSSSGVFFAHYGSLRLHCHLAAAGVIIFRPTRNMSDQIQCRSKFMIKAAGKLLGVFLSGGLADECTSGVNVGEINLFRLIPDRSNK